MLQSLHVKNLALIDEAEVEFLGGLNILTGETGAGKSIIVGSMNLALGEKIPKDMVRDEEIPALVELVFSVDNEEQKNQLLDLGIEPEGDMIILSRRISGGRSVARINSETVTVSVLKTVAAVFIDIYGQHEHQTLLNRKKHLQLLDSYGKDVIQSEKEKMASIYKEYKEIKKKREAVVSDERERMKELELLKYEISEIEAVDLRENEDEELEERYRIMMGSKKVAKAVGDSYECFSGEGESASFLVGRAIREFSTISNFDQRSEELFEQMNQVEDLVSQLGRELGGYLESLNFSEEEFYEVSQRLDAINHLKDRYGQSIEEVFDQLEDKIKRVTELEDYDRYMAELEQQWDAISQKAAKQCEKLTTLRKKMASELTFKVTQALIDLNFLDVAFDMRFESNEMITANGWDDPQFVISVNPGEPLKPIETVASGGELSRIMLAMKSVLAANDKISTLIFDEIDTGISGRTAQMVAEKMNDIGQGTQVISITHLPQIAAMADNHFLIEKEVRDNVTISSIRKLNEEEGHQELARMLGGVVITDAVLQNAKEMRQLALSMKRKG